MPGLLALLAMLALPAGAARRDAAVATSESSPIGTFATVQRALLVAATLPRSSAARGAAERARDSCRELPDTPPGCPALDLARCADGLRALYDALARGTGEGDGVTRNLARVARIQVSDALSRVTWAQPADGQAGCTPPFAQGRTAASIQVSGDGRTITLRPLRPLRAGRAYQLVVEGLGKDGAVQWQAGARAPSAADLAAQLGEAYDGAFAGESVRFRDGDARALLRRLAVDVNAIPDVPATAGARARLGAPLDAAQLSRLRAWFEPARTPAPAAAVLRFRTFDPRAGLIAYQQHFARSACASGGGIAVTPVDVGTTGSAVAGVYRGRYRSLDVAGTEPTSRILGVAAGAARPTELSFLLALPRGFSADTPVVLAVHGHHGRAEAMLKANAAGLARRGMATLALDLPAHGERAGEEEFVEALQPARLTLGLRQATVDALALLHASTGCGFALPDGRRVTPRSLRYLGYSLGAAIGVLLRAVEPALGSTVLVAPPGELADWQVPVIAKRLGMEAYTLCSDGPVHGSVCLAPSECGADGVCVADPHVILLDDVVASAYGVVFAGADPVAFAGERTGGASTAPLLLIAGGLDSTVGPLAGPRLAQLYGMRLDRDGGRRGARVRFAYWPALGHDLLGNESVRAQAYDFLMTGGRRPSLPSAAPLAGAPRATVRTERTSAFHGPSNCGPRARCASTSGHGR